MAKIRLIGPGTWFRFEEKRKENSTINEKTGKITPMSSDELLNGLLGDHDFKFKNLEGIETITNDNALEQESITKDTKIDELEFVIKELNEEHELQEEKWNEQFEKNDKLIDKMKINLDKKTVQLKDLHGQLSTCKKDNKKLGKQVKALTIVEDEEDGDSESGIHGPPT